MSAKLSPHPSECRDDEMESREMALGMHRFPSDLCRSVTVGGSGSGARLGTLGQLVSVTQNGEGGKTS